MTKKFALDPKKYTGMDFYGFERIVERWRTVCGIPFVYRVRGRGAGDDVLVEVGRSERIIIEAPRL